MEDCCPTDIPPVVKADAYKESGSWEEVNGMKVYLAGPKDAKSAVLLVYDIFGIHPNVLQISDSLAKEGHRVVMPDLFRGKEWPIAKFPPTDKDEFHGWLGKEAAYDKVSKDIFQCRDKYFPGIGYGVLGFCWGGSIAFQCAIDDEEHVKAIATAHPSFVTPDMAGKVTKASAMVLPSKDEAPMLDVKEALEKNKTLAHWERFDNMHHGFCAARGDWAVAEQQSAATRAIGLFISHFRKSLL